MDHGTSHSCFPDPQPPRWLESPSQPIVKRDCYATGYEAAPPKIKAALARISAELVKSGRVHPSL